MLNLLTTTIIICFLSFIVFKFAKSVYFHQRTYRNLLFNITKKYRELEKEKLKYNRLLYKYQTLINYKNISQYGKNNNYKDLRIDNVSIIYKIKR
ncbi:MAG TPA: hypothetical protein EYH39_00510 [Desulfurobacteriaceae bacterium]|nr:hypothetical protein [Desulfurobacteriaceae bacterium]